MNNLPIYRLRHICRDDRPADGSAIFSVVVGARLDKEIKGVDGMLPCCERWIVDATIATSPDGEPLAVIERWNGIVEYQPITATAGVKRWFATKAEALVAAAERILQMKDGLMEQSLAVLAEAAGAEDVEEVLNRYEEVTECSR
jgi:hypothetical protein